MQARLWALLCAGVAGSPLFADQVINDDLIVVGNACIGFDCTANQTFPVNGIDLRENNTRLSFNSDAFVLAANESSSGGLNEFRIQANGSGSSGAPIVTFATGGTSVTLGLGSTRQTGAASVGAAGSERRVTGVAEAQNDADLINMGQL